MAPNSAVSSKITRLHTVSQTSARFHTTLFKNKEQLQHISHPPDHKSWLQRISCIINRSRTHGAPQTSAARRPLQKYYPPGGSMQRIDRHWIIPLYTGQRRRLQPRAFRAQTEGHQTSEEPLISSFTRQRCRTHPLHS